MTKSNLPGFNEAEQIENPDAKEAFEEAITKIAKKKERA